MDWATTDGGVRFAADYEKESVRLFELDPAVLEALKEGDT